MHLNIKNPTTHRLATTLARRTGESLTDAVTHAIEEKLERLGGDPDLRNKLLAIGRDCAARLPEAVRAIEHGELLYGDDGLPK